VAVLKRGMLLKIEKRPLLLLLALLPVLAQLKKKSRVLLLIVE
jgi:cell division inhibitor SulA